MKIFKILLISALSLVLCLFLFSKEKIDANEGHCSSETNAKIENSPFNFSVDDGYLVSKLFIKTGSSNNGFGCKEYGSDADDGCYSVSGIGSKNVSVSKKGEGKNCKDISHVEFVKEESVSVFITPTPVQEEGREDDGSEDHKILICHIPLGNSENPNVIDVDKSAWKNGHTPHNSHSDDYEVKDNSECAVKNEEALVVDPLPTLVPTLPVNIITVSSTPAPTQAVVLTLTPKPTSTPLPSVTTTPVPNNGEKKEEEKKEVLGLSNFASTGDIQMMLWIAVQLIGLSLCTISFAGLIKNSHFSMKKNISNIKIPVYLFLIGSSVFIVGTLGRFTYTASPSVMSPSILGEAANTKSVPSRIIIPGINIDAPITEGGIKDGAWILSDNDVLYFSDNNNPGYRFNGSLLYAHKKEGLFKNLKEVSKDSVIFVEYSGGGSSLYKVYSVETVKTKEIDKLVAGSVDDLVLFTCDGLLDELRIVVKARRELQNI